MLVVLVAARAKAERVVLVRPLEEQAQLTELFNRLQGELRMQGFEAMLATAQAHITFAEMKRIAEVAHAQACVALDAPDGQPTVHLWFIDRLKSRAQALSFSSPDDAEAALVLPLRTVELLRSGILERAEPSEPPALVAATPAKPAKPAHPVETTNAAPQRSFSLRGMIGPSFSSFAQPPCLASTLSLGAFLRPHLELSLYAALPLTLATVPTERAEARYGQRSLGAELRLSQVIVPSWFLFEHFAGLGLSYISATAEASAPLGPLRSSGWGAVAHVGTGAWVAFGPHLSLGGAMRLGVVVPRFVVVVEERQQSVGRPNFDLLLGATGSL